MLTLQDILQAKEIRAQRRQALEQSNPGTIISLTLALPGQEKDSPRIRRLLAAGTTALVKQLPSLQLFTIYYDIAGPQALLATSAPSLQVKALTCQLEESAPWARLWDMDVYAENGKAVSASHRPQGRPCLLCGQPATVCMREKRHTLDQLVTRIEQLFVLFAADQSRTLSTAAQELGQKAVQAALYEAACFPSPGLVDPLHTGSHRDMDFFTFLDSTAALSGGLARFAQAGLDHDGTASDLFPVLQSIGMELETAMFTATAGINTHKGLLFSCGLMLGAAGLLQKQSPNYGAPELSGTVQQIAAGLTRRQLAENPRAQTAGEKSYQLYGITGIRGEAEAGFPSLFTLGLPALRSALAQGDSINKALLKTLLTLMQITEDTTILHRQPGLDSLRWVQEQARDFLSAKYLEQDDWQEKLWQLDTRFVDRNLSPGGSADLLALTWLVHRLLLANEKSISV